MYKTYLIVSNVEGNQIYWKMNFDSTMWCVIVKIELN